MACYHPLKAFYRINDNGKKDIVFVKTKDDIVGYDSSGNVYGTPIDIPCGQCVGCRLEYSRQWAVRCVLESMQYKDNYFVTLTYNDEFLPKQENMRIDKSTGEVVGSFISSSLVPDELTKFMKDLRRYFEHHLNFTGIRFFACGEYGPKHMRPHFHIILFNCPIPDLEFFKNSFNGDTYWTSELLERIWSVKVGHDSSGKPIYKSKGYVCVASCNYNTCSYVARYMLKKQKGLNSDYYFNLGLYPPFTRCSRMPGIAKSYYDKNSEKIYMYDQLCFTGADGVAKKVRPPKYFDRLYDIESPDDLKRIKEKRSESAKNSLERRLENTDLNAEEFLKVQEGVFLSKMKKLVRPIE